ncbi:hypothetical protein KGQ74_03295, partial [Patescibacteria group bacterium]|nr:hypothetical protein [Patescibacteria group bacterium]
MIKDPTIVIMGTTGDLAKLKLIPALSALIRTGQIADPVIIGTASS